MIVKIKDYGSCGENKNFILYLIKGLDEKSLKFLNRNLDDETEIKEDSLFLNMYFSDKYYPFGSNEAKIKFNDFKSREEIEMTVFLSSFLEDMD